MALKVRDEEDILEDNLRYHLALGVDAFVITDNASRDRTPEILARYEGAGLAHVIQEGGDDMRSRGHEWVTRMARIAAMKLDADWVIHGDADELWWPLSGTLEDALASVPDRYGLIYGPRVEFVPRPDAPEPYWERLTVRHARALLRTKIAHRAYPNVTIPQRGAHEVAFAGELDEPLGGLSLAERTVLRTEVGDGGQSLDDRLVPAPFFPARVFHFPLRSFEQWSRRAELLTERSDFPNWASVRELRELRSQERLHEGYRRLLFDDAALARGLTESTLVEDTRIRDYLPSCPDPLDPDAGGPPPPPELSPEALEAEREQLERDAMQTLGRVHVLNELRLRRGRERIAKLRDELQAAERRIARLEGRIERLKARVGAGRGERLARAVSRARRRIGGEGDQG